MGKRFRKFWQSLGPGFITGVSDNDPSAIAAYSIAGVRFGFLPLWLLVYVTPFMIAIANMCARIGALSGCGLAGNLRRYYPRWVLGLAVTAIVGANTLNVGADLYGMAGAVNLLIPLPVPMLAIALSMLVLTAIITLPYRRIAAVFKWVALSLFVYGVALVLTEPDWAAMLRHALIPSFVPSREFIITLFAMLGTTLSPYLYFWHASQEAEETRQDHPGIRVCRFRPLGRGALAQIDLDTKIGMVASNLISFFIVSLMAQTLWQAGTGDLMTLRQAAQALEPLAGQYAAILFTLGVIGAGILAIPVLAGSAAYALAEALGWQASIDRPFSKARAFYAVMITAVVVSLVIPFVGITPVRALFWAAVVSGLVAPLLLGLVVHMANNPDIVGTHRSTLPVHALGIGAMFLLLTGAVFVVIS